MLKPPSKELQKYLIPPKNGGLGYVLKSGAPDNIKEEYKKYKASSKMWKNFNACKKDRPRK